MQARTRKSGAERRDQTVQAVLRILGERGVKSLTTAALAEEIGVSTGAIFRHFATLDDVMVETVRVAIARVEETFPDRDQEPLERLMTLAANRVRLLGGEPGLAWLLRSEQASLVLPSAAVEDLHALVRRSRAFLLTTLREGAAAGSIRDDIGAEELLVIVMGTVHTLIGMSGVHGKAGGPGRLSIKKTLAALRTILASGGVASRSSD